jgi:hypothetical protein
MKFKTQILQLLTQLETEATHEIGPDCKWIDYAKQIRYLMEYDSVVTPEPTIPDEPDMLTVFDEPDTQPREHDRTRLERAPRGGRHADQLNTEIIFNGKQHRLIAQRLISNPSLRRSDGYLVLSTKEKSRIGSNACYISSGKRPIKPESELCTPDEIAEVDLHFECTKLCLTAKGDYFNNYEQTYIAQLRIANRITRDNYYWTALSYAERTRINAKAYLIKHGKLKPSTVTVDTDRILEYFGI